MGLGVFHRSLHSASANLFSLTFLSSSSSPSFLPLFKEERGGGISSTPMLHSIAFAAPVAAELAVAAFVGAVSDAATDAAFVAVVASLLLFMSLMLLLLNGKQYLQETRLE